jgi:DNA-binding NtrC family response regulator/tetratricopeptide (TPR) repeat protein
VAGVRAESPRVDRGDAVETPAPLASDGRPLTEGRLARLVAEAAELAARGRPLPAFERIAKELDSEGGHAPIEARAALVTEAALILWMLGRYSESEARARRGLVLAELAGNATLAADALLRLGFALHRQGRLDAAREAYEEALARFRRLGDANKAGAASNNLGLVCKDRGEWDAARVHLAGAIASARRHAPPGVLGRRLQNLGVLDLKSGLWARAEASLEEARVALAQADDRAGAILNAIARGTLERLRRRLPDAEALGQAALTAALAEGLPREEAIACEVLGDVALDRGDLRAARTFFERAQRIALRAAPGGDLLVEVLRRLAALALAEGDPALAGRCIAQARPLAERLGEAYELALLERLEAERLLALGRAEAGSQKLSEVAAALGAIGERFERGRVFARLALLAPTVDEATRLDFRALACFSEAGADAELAETQAGITRRLGAAAAAPAPRIAPRLTVERESLVGPSRALARVRVRLSRIARQGFPALVRGEKGVGKSLVARLVHDRSKASAGPFVPVRCADIPPERILAHLFGDVRPELPARERVPQGALASADGGTLYLDGIDALSLTAQASLLRYLERGLFYRLGELEPRQAGVRVVASTAAAGALRPELLARFARGTIVLPPLRERREDIVPLARAFLAGSGIVPAPRLSAEAADLLLAEPWFGNVRELRECIEQVLVEIGPETALVGPDVLAPLLAQRNAPVPGEDTPREESTLLRARLRELERQRILRSLARARGNKTRAARELKIARKTLYERIRKLGIGEDGAG